MEQRLASGHSVREFLFNQARHVVIRDPAALVCKRLHLVSKYGLLRPEPAVDVLPVVEPVVPRVEEGGVVAIAAKHPEEAVQVPVYHPEGGGRSSSERVGLHACQHVEFRVGSAAGEAGHHDMAGDGVGILPQGVEVGQGVVLRCESESVAVRDIGEGLIHHHNDVHILPQTGVAALVPAGRLRPAEALRLVHRVGGELVAEAVGEPQLVEHGGNIVGVGYPEGVVQIIGGIDCQDQSCQHGKAGGSPQQASHPAAEPGDGEGAAAYEKPQGHQHQREHHDGGDGRHRELDVVSPHSAARFFQQGKVPGKHRLVPYLDLDAVGDRQGADGEVRQRPGEEHVPEQAGEHQQQHPHRQAVQDNQQRLRPEDGQDAPQGIGLAPERQQSDGARQQHSGQKRGPQGQSDFGKMVMELQEQTVLSGWISTHTEYLHYKDFPEKSKAPAKCRVPLRQFCGMIWLEKERMAWTQKPPAG